MKTKLRTSPKDKLENLLNNNFRNNQNYVFGNKLNQKILYYILNKNTNFILGFDKKKKNQEISLNIINDLNILKLIFSIIIYFYLLYFIFSFSYMIDSKYGFIIFIFFSISFFLYLFKSFIINKFSNFSFIKKYIKALNKEYKFYKNKDKVIILRK